MAFGDRKTPLKRTGFTAKAPVNSDRKPRAPLRQRSKKRTTQMRTVRAPEVKALVEAGVTCQVCPQLQDLGITTRCQVVIGGLHERRKSGSGGSRENPNNTMPSCNWGNGYIEDAVGEDRRKIDRSWLVVREGHVEWDLLGARAWREAVNRPEVMDP